MKPNLRPSSSRSSFARRDLGRRRAFTLPEVLISLGLAAVFSLVSVQLLVMTMKVTSAAARSTEAAARLDTVLGRLRSDVWEASALDAAGTTAEVRFPDGSAVTWRVEPDGSVSRTPLERPRADDAGSETKSSATAPSTTAPATAGGRERPSFWEFAAPGLQFAPTADGRGLRVTLPRGRGGKATPAEEMLLVSQLATGRSGK
jgi:prepilin-type N-terminal cleavage/methylation domain-containing protein